MERHSSRAYFAEHLIDDKHRPYEKNPELEMDGRSITWNALKKRVSTVSQKFTSSDRPSDWTRLPVAIIGAGVAGLRTAKILENHNIPYEIFEASSRFGGRLFTHCFRGEDKDGRPLPHDYFDVGAMRYPDNPVMQLTFELFVELDMTKSREQGRGGQLIKYVMDNPKNILLFNGKHNAPEQVVHPLTAMNRP